LHSACTERAAVQGIEISYPTLGGALPHALPLARFRAPRKRVEKSLIFVATNPVAAAGHTTHMTVTVSETVIKLNNEKWSGTAAQMLL
jgi:hypothetical protein